MDKVLSFILEVLADPERRDHLLALLKQEGFTEDVLSEKEDKCKHAGQEVAE